MRNYLLAAAAAVGMSALVVPAAHAAPPDVIHGGCFFNTEPLPWSPAVYTGVIGDLSATTTGDTPPMPIGATVTCWIEADGVEAPGSRFSYSGFGVQSGVHPISYTTNDPSNVVECREIDYADGQIDPPTCFIA